MSPRVDLERLLPWIMGVVVVLVWVGPLQWVSGSVDQISDLAVYEETYRHMAAGSLPYRDFSLEYPPLAAALFWFAGVLPASYSTAFSFLMMLCLVLTVVPVTLTARALGLSPARQAVAGLITACIPLLLGGLVETRFDLLAAALIAWIFWAVVTDRMTVAWVLLGIAVLVKLVPLAFIPVLAIIHARRHGTPAVWRGSLTGLAVVVLVAAPLALLAPSGVWDSVSYHLDRPLQIESTGAAYLMGMRLLAGIPLSVHTSFGSQGLQGGAPDLIALISTIALVVLVLAIALTVLRLLAVQPSSAIPAIAISGIAATATALLVAGKVLSPQFLVWIVPAAVLIVGRRGWATVIITAVALLLTQAYFPTDYWQVVALQDPQMGLVVARDVALIVLLALVWPRRTPKDPLRPRASGQAREPARENLRP